MAARSTSTLSLSARSPRSLDAVAVALARPAATCAHGQRGGSSGSGAARARAARAESRWQAAARSQSLAGAGAVAVAASGSLAGGVAESGAGGGHRSQRAGQERTDRRRPGVLRLDARGPWPVLSRAPVLDEVQPWRPVLDQVSRPVLDDKCLDRVPRSGVPLSEECTHLVTTQLARRCTSLHTLHTLHTARISTPAPALHEANIRIDKAVALKTVH